MSVPGKITTIFTSSPCFYLLVIFRAPVEPPHRSAAAQRPKAANSRVISSQAQQLPGFRSKAIKAARAKPITDNLTRIPSWVVFHQTTQSVEKYERQNGGLNRPQNFGVKMPPPTSRFDPDGDWR